MHEIPLFTHDCPSPESGLRLTTRQLRPIARIVPATSELPGERSQPVLNVVSWWNAPRSTQSMRCPHLPAGGGSTVPMSQVADSSVVRLRSNARMTFGLQYPAPTTATARRSQAPRFPSIYHFQQLIFKNTRKLPGFRETTFGVREGAVFLGRLELRITGRVAAGILTGRDTMLHRRMGGRRSSGAVFRSKPRSHVVSPTLTRSARQDEVEAMGLVARPYRVIPAPCAMSSTRTS